MLESRKSDWDRLFMNFASDVASMSYAVRLKVGAVAVRDRRVIAIGYNGTPKGTDNCCEDEVVLDPTKDLISKGEHTVWRDGKNWILKTKSNVIHAEDNLIRFANANYIDLNDCTLYITHSPCPSCGEKIIATGIKEVVYEKHYRIVTDLHFLTNEGIKVRKWR